MKKNIVIACVFGLFFEICFGLYRQERHAFVDISDPAFFSRILSDCSREDADYKACLRKKAHELIVQSTESEIMKALKKIEQKSGTNGLCHEFTHYLGQEAYRKKQSISHLFSADNYVCFGGFYHGVMEGYFLEKKIAVSSSDRQLQLRVDTLCGNQSGYENAALYAECFHGVGHGLMFVTSMDLPRSLSICDSFARDDQRTMCYGGVFMENSTSTTSNHVSRWIHRDDLLYPCTILSEQYRSTCYKFQSTYFDHALYAKHGTHDWPGVIALCGKIPDAYRSNCLYTVGTNQPSVAQDKKEMIAVCMNIVDSAGQESCVSGIVAALAGWYQGDAPEVVAFCSIVSKEHTHACYKKAGEAMSKWSNNPYTYQSACGAIGDKQYRDSCNSGLIRQ